MADEPAAPEPKTAATKPPEGVHDKDEAIVTSIAPNVCMTPVGNTMVPIPYNVMDFAGHDNSYTPTVKLQGFACMVLRSNTRHVHGDEAGTGGGVISGTHGGICEPIGHEPTVRSEGSPMIRHGDMCWMNNRNTIGKWQIIRSTEVNQCPRPKPQPKGAFERFQDGASANWSKTWEGLKQTGQALKDTGQVSAAGWSMMGTDAYNAVTGNNAAYPELATSADTARAAANAGNFWSGVASSAGSALQFIGDSQIAGDPYMPPEIQQAAQQRVNAAVQGTIDGYKKTYGEQYAQGGLPQALGYGAVDGGKIAVAVVGPKVLGKLGSELKAVATGVRVTEVLETGSYKTLKKKLKGRSEQSNHLNQDAAFRDKIPSSEGAANAMRGNAFTEAGSPHYEFHKSLEGFWDQYRKGGALEGMVPTVGQYDSALRSALGSSGYNGAEINNLADLAAANRAQYGLSNSDLVPRVPGRINQSN